MDMQRKSTFKFVIGMEVAHIGLLTSKLLVEDIKWRTIKKKDSEKQIDILDGIEVSWPDNKTPKRGMFHSGLLVPWAIAEYGEQVAMEWVHIHNKPLYNKVNEMNEIAYSSGREIAEKYR